MKSKNDIQLQVERIARAYEKRGGEWVITTYNPYSVKYSEFAEKVLEILHRYTDNICSVFGCSYSSDNGLPEMTEAQYFTKVSRNELVYGRA